MNAKREAVRLAADECRHFATVVLPLLPPLLQQIKEKHLKSFANQSFTVEKNEIKNHNFDVKILREELPIIDQLLIAFLNAQEAANTLCFAVAGEALVLTSPLIERDYWILAPTCREDVF